MAAQDGGGKGLMAKAVVTTGFPEVDHLLKTLENKLKRKAIRKGTRAGAKIVVARARALVPVDTGLLESTLTVRAAKKVERGNIGHSVTHRQSWKEDPFYAHFVEFGTVRWPGGSPYIRPALYDSRTKVVAVARAAMKTGVDEISANARK